MAAIDNEILTLLNANGVQFDHIPGGARPWLDREAVLASLRGATRAELALALYQAGEDAEHRHLWAGLFIAGSETPEYRELRRRHLGKLDKLCRLAIVEFTRQPWCRSCSGTGRNEEYDLCPVCSGTGRKPLSLRARAGLFGLSHKSWYQLSPMYDRLTGILQEWQDRNLRRMKRRLKG